MTKTTFIRSVTPGKAIINTIVRIIIPCLTILIASGCAKTEHRSQSPDYAMLTEGFKDPPMYAQPKVYWWWLNGNTDTLRMKEELTSIRDAGIGGVDIFEIGVPSYTNPGGMIPAGPAFMSDESQSHIKFAVAEASKLGLEIGFNLASSWNAGGTWTLPRNAAKSLYFSDVSVTGPSPLTITLPFPDIPRLDSRGRELHINFRADGKPEYYEEVAVLALPAETLGPAGDTTGILNISRFFDAANETLSWNPPAGQWKIVRYVCANSGESLKLPSPNSTAPIIDHYDSAATRAHFKFFIDKLKPLLGEFSKTGLKNFYLASYEATGSVWTPTLPLAYKKINGYDIYKLLPALFEKERFNPALNKKFEDDFVRTLSYLMVTNHYRKAREISNKHGLKIISEAGGPGKPLHNVPVEALSALGSLDIPRGEFWNKHYFYDEDSIDILWLVKEIASASNIYRRNIVEEEAFTSFEHWQEGPSDLKPLADRAFCEGMNRVVVHGFTHNPTGTGYPGIVYHAGTHYNDKRIWWPKIRPFNDYLARISFILQKARFSADVLHYYGDKVPNFVYPKNTRFQVGKGYDYEVINTEILLRDLEVKNGKLVLPGGAEFHVLSLEHEAEIAPAVLEKVNELVMRGAVVIGAKPQKVKKDPAHQVSDSAVSIESLWIESGKPVKGKILSGITPLQVLTQLGIGKDFGYRDDESDLLDYVHYKTADLDFYLVRNTSQTWISRSMKFRVQNKGVEIWDPLSGNILSAPVYDQDGVYTDLPLSLPPYGSVFVVFRKQASAPRFSSVTSGSGDPPLIKYTTEGILFLDDGQFDLSGGPAAKRVDNKVRVTSIEGPWEVTFPKGWGAPAAESFTQLISWTDSNNDGIKYFSGMATYKKSFTFSGDHNERERIFLDLGDLEKVGDTWLNGQHLGIAWTKPHCYDITNVIRDGQNELRIEIANTWSNRLTGDAIKNEHYTSTNITLQQRLPWSQVPLLRSGLLGPIVIKTIAPIK